MRVTATVTGLEGIAASFGYVQRGVANGLELITTEGALVVEDEAKLLCPVKTGTLRRSITHETDEKGFMRVSVRVGPTVDYGVYVEFGTRHMAAQPFLRPALDHKGPEAQQVIAEGARQAMLDGIDAVTSAKFERAVSHHFRPI